MKHNPCFLVSVAVILAAVAACDETSYTTISTPSLSLNETSLKVSYEGGDYGLGYSLTNEREDGVFNVEADEDWIENIDTSEDDTVTFTVALQPERVDRKATITVSYTYGDSIVISEEFTVKQTLNTYYELAATSGGGTYYGILNNKTGSTAREYCVWLSDQTTEGVAGGEYYYFDFWTTRAPIDESQVVLRSGEFTVGDAGVAGVIGTSDSAYHLMNEDGTGYEETCTFVDGTVTVTTSSSVTSIVASLEDSNGGTHYVTFSGTLILDNDSYMSSLDDDYDLGDFSSVACEACYFGDYFESGTADWVLNIYPEEGTGFTIDYCGDSSCTYDGGTIPVGTFTETSTGGASGTFLAGTLNYGYLNGTWLVTMSDGSLAEPHAPVLDGTVTVTAGSTEGEYTITVEGTDDRGNTVSGSWTGTPTLVNSYATKAAAQKNRLKF